MSISLSLFSGLRRVSTVPLGSFAKASSLGAKTVNGPSPLRVSTSPAAVSAVANVLKFPLLTAVSTMSFLESSAMRLNDAIDTKATATAAFLINFIIYFWFEFMLVE